MERINDNKSFYKVLFKGNSESEIGLLNLTFEGLSLKDPVRVDPNFIIQIKELADKRKHYIFFQNIEEVLQLGKHSQKRKFNYFYVLLYTTKSDISRKGVLIGNVKSIGDIIIGIWPIDFKLKKRFDLKDLFSELNQINNYPDNFLNITLLN